MTQCSTQLAFPFFKESKLVASFVGSEVTSDAGLLPIRELDERLHFTERLAEVIPDYRFPLFVQHELVELVRQRLYQIIAGYEDCNDASRLRNDPIFKAIAGRLPEGDPLASQPTLCRFENSVSMQDIVWLVRRLAQIYIDSRTTPPKHLVLELDPTNAPTYGHQQLTFFHGYYDEHIYYPLMLCEAASGYVLAPLLRPGNAGGAEGALELLQWSIPMLRAAWPKTAIEFRADSGFSAPALLDWLEDERIPFAIGIGPNDVLERLSAGFVSEVSARYEATKAPQRSFTSIQYAAKTWSHPRRVVVKCEVTELGTNVRYVVAGKGGRSEDLYDWYVARGGTIEHSIEQLKNGFRADRMSCSDFDANQFRLILYAAAYNLMLLFRERAPVPELQDASIDSIRVKLIKIGAVVRQTARRVWVELSTHWPFADTLRRAHALVLTVPTG